LEKVALTGRFLRRKQAEYEALRAEIDSLTAELSAPDASRPGRSGHPGPQAHPANP
jgi:hypothetical protein